MVLQHYSEGGEARRSPSRSLGLIVLGLGTASSALLRVYSDGFLVLTVSSLLLALCINILMVYRRAVDYYLVAISFSIAPLLYSITKFAGIADLYLDLVDLVLAAVLLVLVGYYWFTADMSSLFKAHTPIAVLVSTLVGIYLGLKHPVRLALLTMADALASLVSSSGERSRAESATIAGLFFIFLYSSPVAVELSVEAFAMFAVLYLVRSLAFFSKRLQRYRRRVGDLVSFDVVLKPLLVVLS